MNIVSKEQLRHFVLKEASKIIFNEVDDSNKLEDEAKKQAEDKVKKTKELLDAKTAYYSKLTDPDLKKIAATEVQKQKNDLQKSKEELDDMNKQIQQNKIQKDAKTKEALATQNITNVKPLTVVTESVLESISEAVLDKHKYVSAPVIKKAVPQQQQVSRAIPETPVKKDKTTIVRFDKESKYPFQVKFTQRGFLIGDTRLSFELLEKALSKGFSITLKDGFVLDKVRMQKILKYKDVV